MSEWNVSIKLETFKEVVTVLWLERISSYSTVVRKTKGNGGSLTVGWQEKHSNALLAKIKAIKL